MLVARFVVFLVLVASPLLSYAQMNAAQAFLVGIAEGAPRAERAAAAKAMLEHVRYVSSTLPTIKPSERQWVDDERKAIRKLADSVLLSSRMKQLSISTEYQALELDDTLRNLREALECAADETVNLRREIYCWSVASYHLGYPDWTFAVSSLRRSGRMANVNLTSMGRGPIDDEDSLAVFYRSGQRNIQAAIVLPYLRGDVR